MNDDEVLNAVKQTLSDVQMDRPVEAIEERGRTRRRNRNLFGAVAGGGLAAVAALAVAFSGGQSGTTTPTTTQPLADGGTATSAPAMETVGFTLAKATDGSVKVTLDPKKLLDPTVLEKALAGAGIPAVVKSGVLCEPKGAELPESDKVFQVKQVLTGGSSRYDLVINPTVMPKGSEVYFSVFSVTGSGDFNKFGKSLVTKGAPMNCRKIG
ncbi:hypothetical protein [Actinoplanes sp. L3-i22]|uniref:hypothetical protein n=1 Tax=Actinoplanes sp. L3-i22 TaxID=2836373 RepID=UPI001C784027|nr:hypothetical protein [Actinoplanes sp. L3-i22]BCY15508.1 hypothetical protein L3i22_105960 [Actinoplanes sp. L3-i22]